MVKLSSLGAQFWFPRWSIPLFFRPLRRLLPKRKSEIRPSSPSSSSSSLSPQSTHPPLSSPPFSSQLLWFPAIKLLLLLLLLFVQLWVFGASAPSSFPSYPYLITQLPIETENQNLQYILFDLVFLSQQSIFVLLFVHDILKSIFAFFTWWSTESHTHLQERKGKRKNNAGCS